MIDRIEFYEIDGPGMGIVFYYDSGCTDTYSIFNPSHIREIQHFISTNPEPEQFLVELRHLAGITLH
jgi:hypothetical protein